MSVHFGKGYFILYRELHLSRKDISPLEASELQEVPNEWAVMICFDELADLKYRYI